MIETGGNVTTVGKPHNMRCVVTPISTTGYLEGRWEEGHHRKWCAILTRDQFAEFVEHCGLFAEDVETMGSLGAPGFGYGWAPAISFNSDDPSVIQNAYVTPLPETRRDSCDEQDWDRVRGAVLAVYA